FALEEIGSATLRVKMSPFLAAGKLAAQRVKVSLNGEVLTTLTLGEREPRVYSIELPRQFMRERNVLAFEMPDAEAPQRLGISEDARLLGINVQWLELTPTIAGQ
ncbi:MAG TPA: cellulose biosynthesis cyclic di-GMP-binding regulatory protein BcsB, partial [Pyrinomonadaceae bacterium]